MQPEKYFSASKLRPLANFSYDYLYFVSTLTEEYMYWASAKHKNKTKVWHILKTTFIFCKNKATIVKYIFS